MVSSLAFVGSLVVDSLLRSKFQGVDCIYVGLLMNETSKAEWGG